jgi:hypothetical protein
VKVTTDFKMAIDPKTNPCRIPCYMKSTERREREGLTMVRPTMEPIMAPIFTVACSSVPSFSSCL